MLTVPSCIGKDVDDGGGVGSELFEDFCSVIGGSEPGLYAPGF